MYAIANCDTVKKARKHLDLNKVIYQFHDFKKSPPTEVLLKLWSVFLKEIPVNKKGTTYKKYKDQYEALSDKEKIQFLIEHSSMIKRPILMKSSEVLWIGYDEEIYNQIK